jgi:hypothetical protein
LNLHIIMLLDHSVFLLFLFLQEGYTEVSNNSHESRHDRDKFKGPNIVESTIAVFDTVSTGSLTKQSEGHCPPKMKRGQKKKQEQRNFKNNGK